MRSRQAANVLFPASFLACALGSILFRYPLLNLAAAAVLTQCLVLARRSLRLSTGTATTTEVGRARAAVTTVCALAGIGEIPVMLPQGSRFAAAVRVMGRKPTVVLDPDYVRDLDDAALLAVLAHETGHVVHGDLRRARARAWLVAVCAMAVTVTLLLLLDPGLQGLAPAYAAGLETAVLLTWVLGPAARRAEFRADAYAVGLVGDPEALVRALTSAHRRTTDRRERLLGNRVGSLLLLPFSLRPRTHPPLRARTSRLGPASPGQLERAQALLAQQRDRPLEPYVVAARSRRARLARALVTLTVMAAVGVGLGVARSRSERPVGPSRCDLAQMLSQLRVPVSTVSDPLSQVQVSFEDAEQAYYVAHDRYTGSLSDLAPGFVVHAPYSVVVESASATDLSARIEDRSDPTQWVTTELAPPVDLGCPSGR